MGARSDRSWAQDTPTARHFSTLSARYSQPETVENLWKTRRILLTKLGMLCVSWLWGLPGAVLSRSAQRHDLLRHQAVGALGR